MNTIVKELSKDDLARIKWAYKAVSKDPSREALHYANIRKDEDGFVLETSDGFRLCILRNIPDLPVGLYKIEFTKNTTLFTGFEQGDPEAPKYPDTSVITNCLIGAKIEPTGAPFNVQFLKDAVSYPYNGLPTLALYGKNTNHPHGHVFDNGDTVILMPMCLGGVSDFGNIEKYYPAKVETPA